MGRRRGGHFCWACRRVRPNERFSGRGHARHLCRDCARLGREELALRQAVRTIERLARSGRGARQALEPFLQHRDPRLRELAWRLVGSGGAGVEAAADS